MVGAQSPDDLVTYCTELAEELKPTSTPGYPLCLTFQNNKLAMESDGPRIIRVACQRFFKWLTIPYLVVMAMSPVELVLNGLRDPIYPFLKDEPHPKRKIIDKRWRCIMGLSMVDQLVERLLLSRYSSAQALAYPDVGGCKGIGFSDDHTKVFGSKVDSFSDRLGVTPTSSDIKGWDRSIAVWLMELAVGAIYSKCAIESERLYNAFMVWKVITCRATYVVGSQVYAKIDDGLMPSGSYGTTDVNSVMRLIVAYYCGAEEAIAAGDDCLEWVRDHERWSAKYAELGLTQRDVVEHDASGFSFCSHDFVVRDGVHYASLASWPKAVYRFLCSSRSPELAHALMHEIRHNPNRVLIKNALFGRSL